MSRRCAETDKADCEKICIKCLFSLFFVIETLENIRVVW